MLGCLILGGGFFYLDIDIRKVSNISFLKDEIKKKKENDFRDIDSDKLDLWKVNIPAGDERLKTLMSNAKFDVANSDAVFLDPMLKITKYFPENCNLSPEHVHIIVQSPPPTTTEPPMKKRRLWKENPKEASVIQGSSNKDQKVPVSESEFKRVREYHKLYVDKTEWLTRLELNSGQYFVSWPRKFGKSMFLSMVESFFLVQYNLFENLYIRDHPPDISVNGKVEKWGKDLPSIPVIRLDFSLLTSDEGPEVLKKDLIRVLQSIGAKYDTNFMNDDNVKSAIFKLIMSLANDDDNIYKQVVILIDEYDSPLLNVFGIEKENPNIAQDNHEVLKSFFEVIKALQNKVKFLFVTGVTMFAHLGLFSELNNLKDVTLSNELSGAYGFTNDEIIKVFGDKLSNLCQSDHCSEQDIMNKLQKKYNGYSWDGKIKVYNPYSICSFFDNFEYENFWIQKGKTKFLARLIDMKHVKNVVNEIMIKKRLVVPVDVGDVQKPSELLVSLLFQTGYLTIKQQKTDDDDEQCLILEIPNAEVKESLICELWANLDNTSVETAWKRIHILAKLLKEDKFIEFMLKFNNDLASIPYNESQHAGNYEGYYHSHVHMLVCYIGQQFRSEDATSQGQTDMWIMTENAIYYIEFKRYDPPKTTSNQAIMTLIREAINQVFNNEHYANHTEFNAKTRYAIGCVCSTGTRKICGVGIQEFTFESGMVNKKGLNNFLNEFSSHQQ
ncbi:hypothetical protein C1645_811602 [Glomus cerebriforme]|uniref:Uncharacterized protein n=1 Tax=Glomus cerebriforme TaxID=658196 RepID=A0A397TRU0_9GLOM|nr:hypothetical protein C1645_811602 [Glomus cerebriforme]